MIKRIVILQDEQLVVREIERNMQRATAVAAVAAPAMAMAVPAGVSLPPATACRCRRWGIRRRLPTSEPEPPTTTRARNGAGGRRRRLAGVGRQGGVDQSRARRDRTDAAAGALEPPQGGADSRRELQDAAQQDQGVWHLPRLIVEVPRTREEPRLPRNAQTRFLTCPGSAIPTAAVSIAAPRNFPNNSQIVYCRGTPLAELKLVQWPTSAAFVRNDLPPSTPYIPRTVSQRPARREPSTSCSATASRCPRCRN